MTSMIVLIPVKPTLHWKLKASIGALVGRLADDNPNLRMTAVLDDAPEPSLPTDCRPWSKVTRVRNNLMDRVPWRDYDFILWIDADIVSFPRNLPTRLVESAGNGIAAPLVKIDGSDRFYDFAAFIEAGTDHIQPENRWQIPGRNLSHDPPYWSKPPTADIVPMDCVGSVYVCHTDIYRSGVRHEDDPSKTDHYPICKRAREMGRPVVCDRTMVAAHARLPDFGEDWH